MSPAAAEKMEQYPLPVVMDPIYLLGRTPQHFVGDQHQRRFL